MAAVTLVGLIAGGHSGVPRYAVMLARALDRVATGFPELELRLLTGSAGAEAIAPRNIDVKLAPTALRRVAAGPGRVLLEQALARRDDAGLLHFFDLSGPVLAPSRPFTTTVHDAAVAHGFGPRSYAYKRRLCPWALRHAVAAVAVSAFARDEAVACFGADPSRVRVIHSGPGLEPQAGNAAPLDDDGAVEPFFLYVGNLGANKNLPFLISVFERADTSARLVIAGRAAGSIDPLRKAVEGSPARARIQVVPDADDRRIDGLYRTAIALVHPSRYEGFGFPPLEAMARDCPVLAADIPAIREVSGSGALLLPPSDRGAWTHALERTASDGDLRTELRDSGRATVAGYSWDETARLLCELFVDVSGRRT